MIATHEDADHMGGLSDVFDSYQVARVIDNGRCGAGCASIYAKAEKESKQTMQTEQQPVYQTDAYIGNKNSHVFHHAGCTSVQRMNKSNQVIRKNKEDAQLQGYRPCKLCQP